jgi:NAD(P)H-dependent flavin oxidoreductase YrpB (nitropropane dioxygenase family)
VQLPVVAAGGMSTPDDVAGVIHAGAEAAMVGTVLMRADESGTSATHQAALADPSRTETVITRAFTGRPARGLRNRFIDTYESQAPLGFPRSTTSPARCARPQPRRVNRTSFTCGPEPAIATLAESRPPPSCLVSRGPRFTWVRR